MALFSEAKSGRDPAAQRDAGNGCGSFWHRRTKRFYAEFFGSGVSSAIDPGL